MSQVTSFRFHTTPSGTDWSTCTIDHDAQTIAYTGVATVPFEVARLLPDVITTLADQDIVADHVGETQEALYKPSDGAFFMFVGCAPGASPRTVSPGSIAFNADKAKDLAAGIAAFVPAAP